MLSQSIKNHRTLLAKSPGLPRRATMGCDNPPLPKRSCSFVAVSAMNEQAIDFANSIPSFYSQCLRARGRLGVCNSVGLGSYEGRLDHALDGLRHLPCRDMVNHVSCSLHDLQHAASNAVSELFGSALEDNFVAVARENDNRQAHVSVMPAQAKCGWVSEVGVHRDR